MNKDRLVMPRRRIGWRRRDVSLISRWGMGQTTGEKGGQDQRTGSDVALYGLSEGVSPFWASAMTSVGSGENSGREREETMVAKEHAKSSFDGESGKGKCKAHLRLWRKTVIGIRIV